QVERLRPSIEKLANELIDEFEAEGETELIERFATPIPVAVIAQLLGVPADMAPQLLRWSHDMVAMYQARRNEVIEHEAVKATIAFSEFMRGYVKERRAKPGNDLLSYLIAAEAGSGKLSEDELITTA